MIILALEYTPADQKSLYRRANAFERLGKLNEAISDAQRLISISSKGGSPVMNKHIIFYENYVKMHRAKYLIKLFICIPIKYFSL